MAELLLPGYAWIHISGLSNRLNVSERVVLAFVLSFSFSSLLTAALASITPNYLLLSPAISLGVSAVTLAAFILKWRPALRQIVPNPKAPGLPIFLSISGYLLLIASLFWSSPHYPTAEAFDLLTHMRVTDLILQGRGKEVLIVDRFPTGLHFASAVLGSILQLGSLDALRILTSVIVFAVIPLIFFVARGLFENEYAAGLTVLVGAFALPADVFHLVRIGTFPNIAGDALALSVLWLLLSYVHRPSRALGVSLAFLTVAGMFMHSSFIIFFAALWGAAPLVLLLSKKGRRNYIHALLYSSLGLVALSPAILYFVQGNVGRVLSSYVDFGQVTESAALRIAYYNFVYNIGYFIGWASAALITLGIVLIFVKKQSKPGMILLAVWTTILVAAPLFSDQSYRFVLFWMLPATFLVGSVLFSLSNMLRRSEVNFSPPMKKLVRAIIPLMLVVLVLSGSLPTLIPRVYNPPGRSLQKAVFDSMTWLKGSQCGSVASSGLWPDYQYLPALTGIRYAGDFVKPPEVVLEESKQMQFNCVVVAIKNPYFPAFQLASEYEREYQNEMLAVFLIRASS